jgi:GDPmannose 4,6-dehydratase
MKSSEWSGSMVKTSLITGITGQDGAYLAQLLLGKGHRVVGVVRHSQLGLPVAGLEYLGVAPRVRLVACDVCSDGEVRALLEAVQPDEIYNLASQSSVRQSFHEPGRTLAFNTVSVLTLLDAIRVVAPGIRFYQASSSEMFGSVPTLPIYEDMTFHPLSPYAVSKAAAHWIAKNYRESYGVFAACGILFNHESYLRPRSFFVKKLICETLEVAAGKRRHITVGNLSAKRDFGYAPHYVEAMYLMLQYEKPDDFLICSGCSVSLQEIAHYVCDQGGVDRSALQVDADLLRPLDIPDMYGDNTKARQALGWHYTVSFFDVIDRLIAEEKRNWRQSNRTLSSCP